MIIEFQPHMTSTSIPEQWKIYYKEENEINFNIIYLTYDKLKLFLEQYGYETNFIELLMNFGVSCKNIKQNSNL